MRYQLAANDLDVNVYFPKMIAKKHLVTRGELVAIKDDVVRLCQAYSGILSGLGVPVPQQWSASAKEALKSCYVVTTKELSKHKDLMLKSLKAQSDVNIQRCAYCMLNDPSTWDHYMPKEYFPEYSVYHENLVYICHGCNHRKLSHYNSNSLIYCHPYFTIDRDEALLHCNVVVTEGKLLIQYYGAGGGLLAQAGVIAHQHLLRLDLIARFKGEASSTVNGLIKELQQYYPEGVTQRALDGVLQRRYDQAREELGCNAWDSRLWHGLAACPDFLTYANGKIMKRRGPSALGFRQVSPPAP